MARLKSLALDSSFPRDGVSIKILVVKWKNGSTKLKCVLKKKYKIKAFKASTLS